MISLLQIIDDNKSWFTVNSEKVYSNILKIYRKDRTCFFSFRSFTPRKHWQLQGSRRARVTRIARAVCETVGEADVNVCVKIARALGLDMLYCSPRLVENRAHTDMWRHFACVRTPCGNDAFFSRSDFPPPFTYTDTFWIHMKKIWIIYIICYKDTKD